MERLQKVLSRAGVASRRHAEALIAAGRVTVNGAVVTKWAEGLAGPQGLTADGRGGVFVVENGAGRVRRFTADGKTSVVFLEGLKA